jgi:hypothetical protein
MPAPTIVDALSVAIVDVVVTLVVREPPMNAYQRQHARVQAELDRHVRDCRVRHRLGNDHGTGREAGDHVRAKPLPLIRNDSGHAHIRSIAHDRPIRGRVDMWVRQRSFGSSAVPNLVMSSPDW